MTSLDLILLLARIIQGEGAHLFPDRVERVGIGLAHVALNRQEAWGCDLGQGFYGVANVADPWAVDLATAVLEGKTQDPTGGSLYVFSGEDVREQGFDISSAEWSVLNGQWELHFFREYPGQERQARLVPPGLSRSCASSARTPPAAACLSPTNRPGA